MRSLERTIKKKEPKSEPIKSRGGAGGNKWLKVLDVGVSRRDEESQRRVVTRVKYCSEVE